MIFNNRSHDLSSTDHVILGTCHMIFKYKSCDFQMMIMCLWVWVCYMPQCIYMYLAPEMNVFVCRYVLKVTRNVAITAQVETSKKDAYIKLQVAIFHFLTLSSPSLSSFRPPNLFLSFLSLSQPLSLCLCVSLDQLLDCEKSVVETEGRAYCIIPVILLHPDLTPDSTLPEETENGSQFSEGERERDGWREGGREGEGDRERERERERDRE